jgi:hypothetical protein
MTSNVLDRSHSPELKSSRRLLVIWQNPETRNFCRIGQLDHLTDGRYVFNYSNAETASPDFRALHEFPDTSLCYESASLPAFFRNRIMNSSRPAFREYLSWLAVNAEDTELPVEILARTGGPRATDTFHIVEAPTVDGGIFKTRFFVSGVRHCEGAEERVLALKPGAKLLLRHDSDNVFNPLAMLVDAVAGKPLGWVPDWLVEEVHERLESHGPLEVVVEKVNVDAPVHLRLLCRIESDGTAANR